jgi:hypothetical protein
LLTCTGWMTVVDWGNETDDDVVRSVAIETINQWHKLGRERDLYLPFLFTNSASREQNPLASYGEKNINRLKQISLEYDKTQFFQELQNSGFLLSRI